MKKGQLWQLAVVIAIATNLCFTVLANVMPFSGATTSQVTNKYPTFFTPADFAFAIWGVIYLGLIAFGIYQALPAQCQHPQLNRIRGWVVLNSLATCAWLVVWSYEWMTLSLVAMILMLLSLIQIYRRLEIGLTKAPLVETVCIRSPFSIYLGWLTVTTIANAAVLLVQSGWGGWGLNPVIWTIGLTLLSLVIVATLCLRFADIAYALVIAWAYAGIAVRYADHSAIVTTATGAIIATLLLLLTGLWLRRRSSSIVVSASE